MHEPLRGCKVALVALILSAAAWGWVPARAEGAAPAGSGTPATAWDSFREGERLDRSGDRKAALEAFTASRKSLVSATPIDRSLADALALDLYNLAAAFTTAGDVESSLRSFSEIFRLRAGAGRLRDAAFEDAVKGGSEKIADYAVTVGKASLAVPVYRARLETDPDDRASRTKLAEAYLAAGSFADLRKEVETIRKGDPRSGGSWALTARADFAESRALTSKGDHHEARIRWEWGVADLDEARRLDGDTTIRLREEAETLGVLANLLDEEGDFSDADGARERSLGMFEDALKEAPEDADLLAGRAGVLEDAGRDRDAAEGYGRAVTVLARKGPPEVLAAARGARARCLARAAADAANEARFGDARAALTEARRADPERAPGLEWLRRVVEERASEYDRIVAENRPLSEASPAPAAALRALMELNAAFGRFDEAWRYLTKLVEAEGRPSDSVLRKWAFALRGGSAPPTRTADVEVEGAHVQLQYATSDGLEEIKKALPIAWRETVASLGPLQPGESPQIRIYANQRSFRESGLPGAGAPVTSLCHRGLIALYAEPGRDPGGWTSIVRGSLSRWAASSLSRGRAPRWMLDGVFLGASGSLLDRAALKAAVAAGQWVPVADLDTVIRASWNDPVRLPRLQAEAQALVEGLVAVKSPSAVRSFLLALAASSGPGPEKAMAASAGFTPASLEKSLLPSLAGPSPAKE